MQTQTGDVGKNGLVKGRKDKGQEAVIKLESLGTRVDDLVLLFKKQQSAALEFNDAIKKTAEQSGLLSATVSAFIKAKAGDNFEDKKSKVLQLALVFEECDKLTD